MLLGQKKDAKSLKIRMRTMARTARIDNLSFLLHVVRSQDAKDGMRQHQAFAALN